MNNINEIKEQYNDILSNKIEKIEQLVEEKKISKALAVRLISFYIKKELLSNINTICKFNKTKEKQILFTYQSNTKNYFTI
ncbi:MAG: hypothetical protein US54_C0003G0022 [Candidatus Roizmanbacteria bacterium GW2011_GWA2_37_7]|uniref:Uncharacterized protein n=1 Tax=Candidatus Roizmanbacteria bacterium GW2011_GWA2_37_7 TaxID=1618481 RepID=A0A0G0JPG4_9BACT|nr:MAG: hypothetical protein US54_C0003G0022 [Candidatus Roizmanbacteria bacterium GW2011_GWA2_37_7]